LYPSAPEKSKTKDILFDHGGIKMSTTMANKDSVVRRWYMLNAAGKPLGKTAALAADLLRGKHKVDYTPHVDCGDFVIVINAESAVLTGKKLEQKFYRTHSGYPGGLHETRYKDLMAKKPEMAMMLAVRGMLQKNAMAKWQLRRLKVFRGAEHKHQAQKPVAWEG
jgi:large subunit ribosomal protein L13